MRHGDYSDVFALGAFGLLLFFFFCHFFLFAYLHNKLPNMGAEDWTELGSFQKSSKTL